MLEDELVLSRELAQEFRRKKSIYNFWEKGQATQEVFKDVLRSCRKLEVVKAQLELNLATSVKDNIFINY